jgi:hypothetical protein
MEAGLNPWQGAPFLRQDRLKRCPYKSGPQRLGNILTLSAVSTSERRGQNSAVNLGSDGDGIAISTGRQAGNVRG